MNKEEINDKSNYKIEVKRLLYENAIKSSDAQDARKKEIDNKTNYLITIAMILLGILIEHIDISKFTDGTKNAIIRIFICDTYFITVVLSVIVLGLYMYIFLGKNYKNINSKILVDEKTKLMTEEQLLNEFTDTYTKISKSNAQLNDKQMKIFNIATYILAIEIIMMLYIIITIKMIG